MVPAASLSHSSALPLEFVQHGPEHQSSVGGAAGYDDLRALRQRFGDRRAAEIDIGALHASVE